MIYVLHPAEQLEVFDGARGPTRHVAAEHFKQRERAFAPATADSVGDLAAWDEYAIERRAFRRVQARGVARLVHGPVADQLADVRHGPIFGRLDGPIVIEAAYVVFDDVDLLGEHAQQSFQRIAFGRVAHAIDDRQQFVETINLAVSFFAHVHTLSILRRRSIFTSGLSVGAAGSTQ